MNPKDINRHIEMLEPPYWMKVATDVLFTTFVAAYTALHECCDEIVTEELDDIVERFEIHEYCDLKTKQWKLDIFWPSSQLVYSITDRDELLIQTWDEDTGEQKTFCSQPVINNYKDPDAQDVMAFLAKAATRYAITGDIICPDECVDCGCLYEEDSEAA